MLSFHVIQARHGDCLLLEYGDPGNSRFTLVDGGPSKAFKNSLGPVLEEQTGPYGRKLDRIVVSHSDGDHVLGLIDLLAHIEEQRVNEEPEVVSIGGLWFNSFARALDPEGRIAPRLEALMSSAQANATMSLTGVSVRTFGQGDKLRLMAANLGIPINLDPGVPITVDSVPETVTFANLRLDVVGPTQENLDALRVKWEEWLDDNEDRIAAGDVHAMAAADTSKPNLSSICLVAQADERTILLTGDALGEDIIDGAAVRELLDDSGRAHFDLLKVPHHGSNRNVTKPFFETITADRYVISGNGSSGNPDFDTLQWLVTAASEQERSPDIYFTNSTPATRELLRRYPPSDYGYRAHFLPESDRSMEIVLA